jgi:threonine/homoserine/homoserine lactone efflux protein
VDASRLNVTFFQGVLLQFLNIKAWMLALSVVAGWIAGRPDAIERTLQVLPLMLAFGFFSNLTYATTGSLLRGWLAHGQRLLVFNRCMAAALVLTAVWMLWSAR